ncbi:hypothetical protein [Nocardioides sp. J54]|uniref:hypothetical protein n=1 Tax=Nocardioides sp. J54 TaxID=935866 RepID=UPI00048AD3D7|nr:hypothetical protein [Nocardioides sp. J54]
MAQRIKIIYTPEGGSRRDWIVDLQNPSWDLTYATEKATDWPWGEFTERLGNQSAIATRALLWVLRKRDEPRLTLEAVVPDWDELDFEAECPRCGEWVVDDGHACAPTEAPETDEPAEASPGEA